MISCHVLSSKSAATRQSCKMLLYSSWPAFFFTAGLSRCFCIRLGLLRLKHSRTRRQNDNQTSNNQPARNHTHHHNAPPAGRKLASYDVVLSLEIPVEPYEQHQDRNANKRRSKRLPQMPQSVQRMRLRFRRDSSSSSSMIRRVGAQRAVEAEELRDSYPDGSKAQTCAQPG